MNIRTFTLALFMCALVAACGIKPGEVDSPAGVEKDRFPHAYPDIGTDPK